MKESKTAFAYIIEHMTELSFEKVRNISCDFVMKLPSELVDELFDQLNRGVEILDSEPLLQMYFYSYGQMHAEKLTYAFKQLSPYIKSAEMIDIVDYGCGQGLATMCYHDYVKNHNLRQQVRSITLIEPSPLALSRAELLCSCFFPNATITAIQKNFDELLENEIATKADCPTLHLFSNILDVESFAIKPLVNKIRSSWHGDNEFVIVSPIQNSRRMGRLKEFVNFLGINCYFENYLDKQQLRDDKDWTCCVMLCSTRISEFAFIDIDEIQRKTKALFEDVTLCCDNEYAKTIFDEVKICAENGVAKCMNFMGFFYAKGIIVEKCHKEALKWYKAAADYGVPQAFSNLALMYARGEGIEKNIPKAKEIIGKIKESDAALYHVSLGKIEIIAGNDEDAFQNFRIAAELGNAKAKYYYGMHLLKGKCCDINVILGIKNLKSAAEDGCAIACLRLASFYEKGAKKLGIKQSDKLCVAYFKTAAKKGNIKAQKRLAEIYSNGILGVSKNQKESFKWYLIAAKRGEYHAAFYVAFMYDNGTGIAQNYTEAVNWYTIAANHGSSSAMNNLAICYENGHGIEKDEEKAFTLYLKAAEAGRLKAADNVSVCFQKGTGTEINPQKALFWKEKAANGGNSKAQETLAKWYFIGYGTERNYEKALSWFIKSQLDKEEYMADEETLFEFITKKATDGNALFQYLLAKCYSYGVFVPKDRSLSMMWYEKSAANGYVESLIKLRRIDSISTEATKEEIATGIKDEYGVLYSSDWKKVLSCSFVHCKSYSIRKGTRIICDGTFANQCIERFIIPSSVVAIGDNPFSCNFYYHETKKEIDNKSSNYITLGDALYSKDGLSIISYQGNKKQFTIPEHVVHIANHCFSNANNLETVIIPEGIQTIGRKAFEDCHSLKSLDLPKSVEIIGEYAFYGCEDLEEILSLGSIKTIECNTFEGCNLKHVHLPACLVSIMDNAFNSNSNLQNIDLPDTVETIGKHAFAYCNSLEHIHLGENVRFIGDFCFFRCALKAVRLPSSLTKLGIRPFDNIDNIITKREGIYKAEGGMLINTKNQNLECIYGDSASINLKGIKSISPLAFYKSKVVEVIMSNDIIILPEYTFYKSSNLIKIKLSKRLKFIAKGAFYGCEKLCNISIPKSVKGIEEAAFGRCISLEIIELKGLIKNISESLIEYKYYEHFPSSYEPRGILGNSITELDPNFNHDIETFKCITIVVPKSTKDQYSFKPIYHLEWDQHEMDRRFEIIESDEDC